MSDSCGDICLSAFGSLPQDVPTAELEAEAPFLYQNGRFRHNADEPAVARVLGPPREWVGQLLQARWRLACLRGRPPGP